MKISFDPNTLEQSSEADEQLSFLAESGPIRMRLHPQLYYPSSKAYRSWRQQAWTVEIDSLEEMLAFREALAHFMRFTARYGAVAIARWFADTLQQMKPEQAGEQAVEGDGDDA